MATFKNENLDILVTAADGYEVPAAKTAIVLGCQLANVDGVNSVDCDVWWTDDSDADKVTYLVKGMTLPAKAAVGVLEGKLVLEAGDRIRALAGAAGDAQLSISVLEL